MPPVRRLTAILAADVAGYSRLMGADEEGTHERLKAHLRELVEPKIAEHRGRVVKNTGDGFLAEFASVVGAVRCAVEVQRGMAEANAAIPPGKRIEFRVGINLGDVIAEGEDIFGDGVNIAARLEALAEPGGVFISNTVHDHVRDRLPFVFEDLGEHSVKNIARPVRVYRVHDRPVPIEQPSPTAPEVLPLPDKPSIAVLPFQNMSGDPEQEYFADGMVEEIITALSRIRWLFVIARNSSFTYKGRAVDLKQVGQELGVRYVLEGSVRRGGNSVRITAQLIDATDGSHLWADRFDGALDDVFELQDRVAISVAGVIEPTLEAAETRRSAERPTCDLTAYDLYLRALLLHLSFDGARVTEALSLLHQAIDRDPQFGPALALASWCHVQHETLGLITDAEANRRAGQDLAQRALQVAGDDITVLAPALFSRARFGGDVDAAIAVLGRSLARNPSSARAWYVSGWLHAWAGQADTAIEHFETAARLNPRDQAPFTEYAIGVALALERRFSEAIPRLLIALQQLPRFTSIHRFLAVSYAHMSRPDEARAATDKLRAMGVNPAHSFVRVFRRPEHQELIVSGLRLAAGEAT
jgi:TolB-like protein/class 3 adenylate cyclase